MDTLSLEMMRLIQKQQIKIDSLTKKTRNSGHHLLKLELENYILAICLQIIAKKYNLSSTEKTKIILQAISEIFPNNFL